MTEDTIPDAIITQVDDQRWAYCRSCTRTSGTRDPYEWAKRHNKHHICVSVVMA